MIQDLKTQTIRDAVFNIHEIHGAFDENLPSDVIQYRKDTAQMIVDEIETEGSANAVEDGWTFTSETPRDFVSNGWTLCKQSHNSAKLTRADGSDIYFARVNSPLGDFLTWLDRA